MPYDILCIDVLGLTKGELSGILKKADINLIQARDETEALSVIKCGKYKFNAVVWSISLPDLMDFELIKRIRGRDGLKKLPLIAVSQYTDKKHIIKAIEAGAVEYIAKPFEEAAVIKKFSRIIGVSLDRTIDLKDDDIVIFNFAEMLNRELKAASRGGYCLSMVLASVLPEEDSDNTGRAKSEDIISEIIKVMRLKLRETDSVFHYGSNNLIVLLPFSDRTGAGAVQSKLQDIYRSHTLIRLKNKGYTLVTASVNYPDDGKIKEKLLGQLECNFEEAVEQTHRFGKERAD